MSRLTFVDWTLRCGVEVLRKCDVDTGAGVEVETNTNSTLVGT